MFYLCFVLQGVLFTPSVSVSRREIWKTQQGKVPKQQLGHLLQKLALRVMDCPSMLTLTFFSFLFSMCILYANSCLLAFNFSPKSRLHSFCLVKSMHPTPTKNALVLQFFWATFLMSIYIWVLGLMNMVSCRNRNWSWAAHSGCNRLKD